MERRITKKIEAYQVDFKNAIKDWLVNENINLTNNNGLDKTSEFLQFVYDYNGIGITKEDFQKRSNLKYNLIIFLICQQTRKKNFH